MSEYTHADEVKRLAVGEVIPNWHPHLQGVPIAWVLADEIPASKGKTILAKTKGLNALDQFLTGNYLAVIVNEAAWVRLDHAQRLALLDHELCHVIGDTDTGFAMRHHDVEEFNDVIERHGAWSRDVLEFLATARKAQIELPLELSPEVHDQAQRLADLGATVHAGGKAVTFTAENAVLNQRLQELGGDFPPKRTVEL